MGLIIPSAATHFDVEVTTMASQFTWFTGAVFVGYILSFVVFDKFSIKQVLITAYVTCIAAILLIHFTQDFTMLAVWFAVFGIAISLVACGSSTLITQIWEGKARQTVLVAQDALFNGGGVIFSMTATWFAAGMFQFSSTYLVVAGIIICTLGMIFTANFDREIISTEPDSSQVNTPEAELIKTRWNLGIIMVGISLMLFMLAKIAMFIWAPLFVEQKFEVGGAISGEFMSNVFTAALIGSLAGTWLASRMNVKYLLYIFVLVSTVSVWLLTSTDDIELMLLLAFAYGISISATFNAYMAYALSFVAIPTHRNIAYMLVMSALGSSLAPVSSSMAVDLTGDIADALLFCLGILVLVVLTLGISEVLSKPAAQTTAGASPETS
ncbi:MFS transporter [Pseudomonadales bacterium]|nr:MFS transporter [Pseudomonadales bacterium]